MNYIKMVKIITTAELQKNIGKVSADLNNSPYIVTKNGKGSMFILPYFDDSTEKIQDLIEDMEMQANKKFIVEDIKESLDSGISDFSI
jgi:hypothetical protein